MWRVELAAKNVEVIVLELTGGTAVESARSTDPPRVHLRDAVDLPMSRLFVAR